MKRYYLMIVAVTSCLSVGCSSLDFDMNRSIPWTTAHKEYHSDPVQVVAYWEPAQVRSPQGDMHRGFGGRVMFVDPENGAPIEVSGTLTVYAFDELTRQPGNPKPDRKYVFEASHLKKLKKENDVGVTYNVWLPWDPAGGPEQSVSLVARFEPEKDGPVSIGESCKLHLSGPVVEEQIAEAPPEQPMIRQTSLAASAPEPVVPRTESTQPGMRVTTIGPAPSTQRSALGIQSPQPVRASLPHRSDSQVASIPRQLPMTPTQMSEQMTHEPEVHPSTQRHVAQPVNVQSPVRSLRPRETVAPHARHQAASAPVQWGTANRLDHLRSHRPAGIEVSHPWQE